MMKNTSRPSIDGFTLTRRTPAPRTLNPNGETGIPRQFVKPEHAETSGLVARDTLPKPVIGGGAGTQRTDIAESLRAVDETPPGKHKKQKRQKKLKRPHERKRWYQHKVLLSFLFVLLLIGGGGAYFVNKLMSVSGRVFSSGSVLDLIASNVELQKDPNGRTNILLFGTSEDDPGHGGAMLTDSVMVLSLDKTNKSASMVSMPRDLWVDYGMACTWGYAGKINALYQCYAGTDGADVAKGANALKSKVGEIFGLDVQYYVKVDYTVVRQLTTALGGVTVNIEGAFGASGIYDSGMGKLLKLPNGPATIQGEQALAFARARGEGYGSYGLNGDFSRMLNQQKLLVAVRDKALSLGTLSNPAKVIDIMDALGDNIRTNFSVAEVKALASIGKDISPDKIVHIDLNDNDKRVVTTGMMNGQSIVKPVAGIDDYTKIQAYIRQQMNGGSVESEDATIQVLNGSGKVGAAGAKQTVLTQAGLLNVTVGDTTYAPKTTVVWYDTTAGKAPKTLEKLTSVLGVKPAGTTLPAGVKSASDFVIILGTTE